MYAFFHGAAAPVGQSLLTIEAPRSTHTHAVELL